MAEGRFFKIIGGVVAALLLTSVILLLVRMDITAVGSGRVEPVEWVRLTPEAVGVVERIADPFRTPIGAARTEPVEVSKGDVILELVSDTERMELRKARGILDGLVAEKELVNRRIESAREVSATALSRAKAELAAASARLQEIERRDQSALGREIDSLRQAIRQQRVTAEEANKRVERIETVARQDIGIPVGLLGEPAKLAARIEEVRAALRQLSDDPIGITVLSAIEAFRQQLSVASELQRELADVQSVAERGFASKSECSRIAERQQRARIELELRRNEWASLAARLATDILESAKAVKQREESKLRVAENELEGRLKSLAGTDLTQAQAVKAAAEAALKRVQAREEISALEIQLRALDSRAAAAKSDVELAATRLERRTIKAHISGLLVGLRAREGELLSPGQDGSIGVIERGDQYIFRAYVRQHDIARVVPGQRVEVYLNAYPYRKYDVFNGVVRNVSEAVQKSEYFAGSPVWQVDVLLDPPEWPISRGMEGLAEVVINRVRVMEYLLGLDRAERIKRDEKAKVGTAASGKQSGRSRAEPSNAASQGRPTGTSSEPHADTPR